MAQTFADAKRIENAIKRLSGLQDRTPAEDRALATLQAQLPAATAEIGATGATYRGFGRSLSGGLKDEAAGAISAMQGGEYTAGRNQSIERDRAAQEAFPREFGRGSVAGGAALAGLSMGVGGPSLAGKHMMTKIGAGALGGGVLGAAQGQSQYEMAGRPEGQRLDYMMEPMGVGASTGAVAYPLGAAVGGGVRAVRNIRNAPRATGFGAKPISAITRALSDTRASGVDIEEYLGGLTDEAMLADVPGPLQGTAQGLAAMRGAGGSQLARAVTERGDSAGGRIAAEMDAQIDQPNAAFDLRQQNAAARSGTYGPMYDAALRAEGALEVRPLLNQLDEAMRIAGPDTAPALLRFADDLRAKSPNGLISPEQLHWIRSDIAGALGDISGPTKNNAMLLTARNQIDEILNEVPGYKDARTGYANTFAMDRASEQGQEALRGARATASSPAEFEAQFSKLSDAEKDAFRKGLRRDIAGLMGTSKNDAAAAWGEFSKTWNPEKLRIALGDEAAEPIIKRLKSEKVFSETRGRVTAGSRTAETQEQREALGDFRNPQTGQRPGPVGRVKNVFDDTVNAAIDSAIYGNRTSDRNRQLGEILSMQGPERDELLRKLIASELMQGQPSRLADNSDRLIRALTAASGGAVAANSGP